jgi:2,4-dienoyl-CoA reductase (NADPH2)
VADSIQVCKWLIDAGADSIHVSTGSSFPHPRNPAGSDFPVDVLGSTYEQLASSGTHTFRNFLFFRGALTGEFFKQQWLHAGVPPDQIEGLTLPDARQIKQAVNVPVLCTGGFQTASVIRAAIDRGDCDGVSIARPLVANNDLVNQFKAGKDRADKPCTYCNKCLVHVVEHPIGCYEESRFASREEMIAEVMSVFSPPAFT